MYHIKRNNLLKVTAAMRTLFTMFTFNTFRQAVASRTY